METKSYDYTEDEYQEAFEKVKRDYVGQAKSEKSPRLIFATGQPASGKSALPKKIIKDYPNVSFIYQCDLSDKSSINNTFDRILSKFNHVDILINNAGIIDDASFVKMTDIQMKHVLDVNFYGSFYCIKKILPIMIIQNYGKIVNVSSTSKFGTINKSNYAASKAALDALTRTISKEVAAHNITINSVAPTLIDTDMLKTIPTDALSKLVNSSPMKRLGKPEEIASIIYFLSSDDSSYITGETLIASGGLFTI